MDSVERGRLYFLKDVAKGLGYPNENRLREMIYRKRLRAVRLGQSYIISGDDLWAYYEAESRSSTSPQEGGTSCDGQTPPAESTSEIRDSRKASGAWRRPSGKQSS